MLHVPLCFVEVTDASAGGPASPVVAAGYGRGG